MNKYLFLTGFAALALASCSNDESIGQNDPANLGVGNVVSFNTSVGVSSKGTTDPTATANASNSANGGNLAQAGFTAYAYPYNGTGVNKVVGTAVYTDGSSQAFSAVDVRYANKTWKTYAGTSDAEVTNYKWYEDDATFSDATGASKTIEGLDFYATSSVKYDKTTSKSTQSKAPAITLASDGTASMTYQQSATVAANNEDLLVGTHLNVKKENAAQSGVSLDFKHALAQIEFKALNNSWKEGAANAGWTVKVSKVQLCNVPSKAKMTFPTATSVESMTADTLKWDTPTDALTFASTAISTPDTLSATAVTLNSDKMYFMMVPQKTETWQLTQKKTADAEPYILVTCAIYKPDPTGNGKYINAISDGNSASLDDAPTGTDYTIATPLPTISEESKDFQWKAGKKYTYTLNFFGADAQGGAGYWAPTDSGDPHVSEKASTTPGKPIFTQYIKFVTVTVDDWVEQASDMNL